MSIKVFALAGTLVLAAFYGAPALAGESAEAGHDAHSHAHSDSQEELTAASLELNEGRKWQTDAPLRQGMEGIRNTMKDQLQVIHQDALGQASYIALADQVESHVGFMFENCELPPKADAQLHTLLAHILQGTEQMRTGEVPRSGAVQVVKALDAYSTHFDHQDWRPLSH